MFSKVIFKLLLVFLLMFVVGSNTMGAGKTITLSGEIVDVSCYISHGSLGAKHKQCALQCLAQGAPFGLVTKQGKLYILIPHHSKDIFLKLKSNVAKTVTVIGDLTSKGGVTAVFVEKIK